MAIHNNTGYFGEMAATEYLQAKGYRIRHVNWRSGKKEIDIVAEYNGRIVIIEVKTRSENSFILPEKAVDRKKIMNMVRAADAYIKAYKIDKEVQFDIVAITGVPGKFEIEHIEDSFLPPVICK